MAACTPETPSHQDVLKEDTAVDVEVARQYTSDESGTHYVRNYSMTLDSRGNVASYDFEPEGELAKEGSGYEPVHVTLSYDNFGVATSCEGTHSWTQRVIESTENGSPLIVERVWANDNRTLFSFDYYPDGRVRSYTVTVTDFMQVEYEFNESGWTTKRARASFYDGEIEDEPTTTVITYEAGSQEHPESAVIDYHGIASSVTFSYNDAGQLIGVQEVGENTDSRQTITYQTVDNPSPMARMWAGVGAGFLSSLCPLSNPEW